MNEMSIMQMSELAQVVRHAIDQEGEQLMKRAGELNGFTRVLQVLENLIQDNQKQQEEIESLKEQLSDEKKQRAELEMKMAEMSKLSAGVAKKASEEAVLQALRTYVNRSKRKTADKRAFAKTAILEMANANGLMLPEELSIMIDFLDDELSDQKVVNVTMHNPKIDGPLYGISHNENVNLGGRIHG